MIERTAFFDHVRDAFAHLHDLPSLRSHPLTKLLGRGGQELSGAALRRALLDCIEQLKPPEGVPQHSVIWRRYRYMVLRYVEGASHEDISRELLVSTRQARRDHLDALDAVSSILWDACQASWLERPTLTAEPGDRISAVETAHEQQATLDAELAKAGLEASGHSADLAEALAGVVEIAGRLAESVGGAISASASAVLPHVAVDRTILRQVLLSLLSYAIQERPGGRAEIAATPAAEAVRVQIVASGGGKRAATATGVDPSAEDTALLSVGQHLAELHGMDCRVSLAGTDVLSIELLVPVARPLTVLVIDDNPDIARLFERYLRGTQYRLVHAKTWQRALRAAEEAQPDVITLDVIMPSLDGWDVLRQLRMHPATRNTPIIVCSVLPDRTLALAQGVTEFLPKPVTRQSLLAALRRCQPLRREARLDCSGGSASPLPPSVPRGE